MANLRANRITSTETFETTGSVQFDGTGNDELEIASSNDFAYGTGDFTWEAWIYAKDLSGNHYIIDHGINGGTLTLGVFGSRYYNTTTGQSNVLYTTGFGTLSTNTWYHLAAVRRSGTTSLYTNGVLISFASDSHNYGAQKVTIGNYGASDGGEEFDGHISNLRVLKGTALYTKNFTPPTRELTVTPETVLLACQSTTNAALEKTGKTITVNGNAVANELTPGLLTDVVKSGGTSAIAGSVEFTTSIDALQVPAGSDFAYGTGDFTIEAWIQPQGINGGETKAIFTQTQSGNDYIVFKLDSDKAIKATFGATTITGGTVEVGSWNHVAVTRSSNTVRVFVNGIASSGTTVTTDFSDTTRNPTIGQYTHVYGNIEYVGFISNLRIVKGTALYTSNFTPPTRELKKIPNTVLLCCKDSSNPTAEETGKTITPYGSLDRTDLGVELVTNGGFSSASGWTQGGTNATISSGVLNFSSAVYNIDYQQQSITFNTSSTYVLTFDILNYSSGGAQIDIVGQKTLISTGTANANGRYSVIFTPPTNTPTQTFRINATGTFNLDNVSVTKLDPGTKPAFTPSVGSDGTVTFEGTTKINTPNYFYLPTGNTEDRGRGRGVFGGGYNPSVYLNTIQFINIQSSGTSQDFGDLSAALVGKSGCSSSIRGIFSGGFSSPVVGTNSIEYITIASQSNATDFGDLLNPSYNNASCSSSTRGMIGEALSPGYSTTISYVTIPSTGDAKDFGDLSGAKHRFTSCSSPTRGIFAGGTVPSGYINIIDYITITSTGNAQDFGDLSLPKDTMGTFSSTVRGVFAGGYAGTPTAPSATVYNTIEYITISSTGNTSDFGDLQVITQQTIGCSNSTRGIVAGGRTPAFVNNIDYIIIASTSNSYDFGDLIAQTTRGGACSDSHGGLS
jgi:hypothetical protein